DDDTHEWSPYTYVLDNPALHTDPDGRQAGSGIPMTPEMAELWGHFVVGAGRAVWSAIKFPITVLTLDDNTPDFGPLTGIQESFEKFRSGGPAEKMEVL